MNKLESYIRAHAFDVPTLVLDINKVEANYRDLKAGMPTAHIHYAVKANPYAPLLAHMAGLVDGFDIASGGELAILQGVGIDPRLVSFAGPGKRDRELEAAIAAGPAWARLERPRLNTASAAASPV